MQKTGCRYGIRYCENGGKPFWGVLFLQRTYDQLSQDVCINQSAVTISVLQPLSLA
ncbi:MAG: hypothetical protein ACLUOF_11705 [Ruminococcus sp.]